MEADGIATTQSTLSRDLRELGVIKGPQGYRAPETDASRPHLLRELAGGIRPHVEGIDAGGNIVVVRCRTAEGAREVAGRIDEAGAVQTVAAVAIGATVLVVARTPAYARDLARAFRRS